MFKGLGQLGDMAKMMKAAKEMQERMAALQEDLGRIVVTGEAGAGLVQARATARVRAACSFLRSSIRRRTARRSK